MGLPHSLMMERHDALLVVRRIEVEYWRPARLDDALVVETRVIAVKGVTLVLDQRMVQGAVTLAALRVELACVDRHGLRPKRIPEPWRSALERRARFDGKGRVAVDRSVTATDLGGALHDLSLWGLFLQADWVVKPVMLGLLLASVWVWAIVFEKLTSIRRANRAADAFEDSFWSGGSLEDLFRKEGEQPTHPMAAVFGAAHARMAPQRAAAGAAPTSSPPG